MIHVLLAGLNSHIAWIRKTSVFALVYILTEWVYFLLLSIGSGFTYYY